jgi:hypothetical protein
MCINQTSNDERNHPVGMTGKINAHAEEVCMWMGEMKFADQLWNPSPIEEDPGRCITSCLPSASPTRNLFHQTTWPQGRRIDFVSSRKMISKVNDKKCRL